MAKRITKRKCKHCHNFFRPDPRNAWHQEYCTHPECRRAGKTASQAKWLMKEENRDYFRGPANVLRVQQWRSTHPGYWRKKRTRESGPLQDLLIEKAEEIQNVGTPKTSSPDTALQDILNEQPAVLIGLIAHLTGSPLQDHITLTTRRLQQLGADILNCPTQNKGGSNDPKASDLSTAYPKDPHSVQLGGSPPGP